MSNYFTVQTFRRCTEISEKMEASILAALLSETVSGPTLRPQSLTRGIQTDLLKLNKWTRNEYVCVT